MKKLGMIAAASVLLASCVKTQQVATAKVLNIQGQNVSAKQSTVELHVSETKVSGSASGKTYMQSAVLQMAVNDAISKAKADILVEPNYEFRVKGQNVTVIATGFPGTYKNFEIVNK